MTCRNCKHYDLAAVQDKIGRVRRDSAARCLFDFAPILAQLPLSVSWRDRPNKPSQYMEPYGGEGCPQFKERS